jgi:hypothetical protein
MLLLKRGIVYVSIGLKSTKAIPVTFLQISNMKTINIDNKSWLIMSPPHFGGETYCFCPVRLSVTVCQRNSSETTEQNFMKLGR